MEDWLVRPSSEMDETKMQSAPVTVGERLCLHIQDQNIDNPILE
jgi:hypothetical protein